MSEPVVGVDLARGEDRACTVVAISLEEYQRLVKDSEMLAALHAGGVDNWEWYSEALSEFFIDDEEEEQEIG